MGFRVLSKDECEMLLKLVFIESNPEDEKRFNDNVEKSSFDELPFLSKIVQRRIEVLKLPIKFSPLALIAICCFARVAGEAVVLLIDVLNKYENEIVTVSKLVDLYPAGFYDQPTFESILDNLKGKKWSEIY